MDAERLPREIAQMYHSAPRASIVAGSCEGRIVTKLFLNGYLEVNESRYAVPPKKKERKE